MEADVGGNEVGNVLARRGRLEVFYCLAQALLLLGAQLGGSADTLQFHHHPQPVDVADVVGTELAHDRATLWVVLDQATGDQDPQRLTCGVPGDATRVRERGLTQRGARADLPVHDPLEDLVGKLVRAAPSVQRVPQAGEPGAVHAHEPTLFRTRFWKWLTACSCFMINRPSST